MDLTIVSGAGSIISNVLDYSKWLRSLITATGPLSQSQITDLLTPRTLVLEKEPWLQGPKAYTLGWFNGNYRGVEYFEHSGGLEAFGAQVSKYSFLRRVRRHYGVRNRNQKDANKLE
jgi:hypothetical protein